MTVTQVFRIGLISVGFSLLFLSAFVFGEEGESSQAIAVLKIEGTHIEHLELESRDGQREEFTQPGETVELPPGEYHVYMAQLKGGYTCFNYSEDKNWITVAQGQEAVLKVGGPLEQKVVVKRRGSYLQLNYELKDGGDNAYRDLNRENTPRFAIFKGDKEIASGEFAYG